MCIGNTPSAPRPPPALPEAPRTPDPSGGASVSDADRRRRAVAGGASSTSTILTGARGVQDAGATQTKTLLGA